MAGMYVKIINSYLDFFHFSFYLLTEHFLDFFLKSNSKDLILLCSFHNSSHISFHIFTISMFNVQVTCATFGCFHLLIWGCNTQGCTYHKSSPNTRKLPVG